MEDTHPDLVAQLAQAYTHIAAERFGVGTPHSDDTFQSKKKKRLNNLVFDGDYPIIPMEEDMPSSADGLQAFIWAFLTWHYRKWLCCYIIGW